MGEMVMKRQSYQWVKTAKETYSKSALQVIDAYFSCRERRDHILDSSRLASSADMMKRGSSAIWHMALERSDDDFLGLQAGSDLANHVNGNLLVGLIANSQTAGDALRNLCRYHSVCSDDPHPYLARQTNRTCLALTDLSNDSDENLSRHMGECLFSAIVTALSNVCTQPIYPIAVRFSWPAPQDVAPYRAVFNAPIFFSEPTTELEYANRSLETTIPYADDLLLGTLTRHADKQMESMQGPETWASKVAYAVRNNGPYVDADINTVSMALDVGPRTLQKHLKSEGTSYQRIIRDIKIGAAKDYLADRSNSLIDIAILLGYSEQSAFNHAFKLWTGLTPRQFRMQNAVKQ